MIKLCMFIVIVSTLTGANTFADSINTTEVICTKSEKGTTQNGLEDSEIMLIVQRSFPSNLRTLKLAINGEVMEDHSGEVKTFFLDILYSVKGVVDEFLVFAKSSHERYEEGFLRLSDGRVIEDMKCTVY